MSRCPVARRASNFVSHRPLTAVLLLTCALRWSAPVLISNAATLHTTTTTALGVADALAIRHCCSLQH
ncbi:hypothetical protein PF005_g7592 [Phytophthora fragariae]|uniref:RxLR effector protein n=1 Tax=Phytophthora fragariae TaxID=53985 RepID=A0A6A3F7E3_9STRA|nr:hypothetical protein PF009_g8331 [Phytophthora fragariae]KAE9008007.1 hypothetical protein PF011_g10875 [Phytophthora fragariae]KAE9109640.1 hypothetical protein PF010_g11456 [Phytophthora fragariae]KAE9121445.1 hypothetical protein PF007_g7812 [Phytophthora fragariae]KAE9148532.1 hypothetical protein PF006_g6882 [Phytophthora fragariae]